MIFPRGKTKKRLYARCTHNKKPLFLLKMCDEWAEAQTQVMIGSMKYRQWDGRVSTALVDEILATYDRM